MIPNHLSGSVLSCHTHEYEALNTSDHTIVTMCIGMGNIPRGSIEGVQQPKLRWDKMSPDDIKHRYRRPLEESLRGLLDITEYSEDRVNLLMTDIITAIKAQETQVPKSRFKRHIKSYWCPELNQLKRVKVQAFRAWVAAGRPRESNNEYYTANKDAKKVFRKRLKQISREYDECKIKDAVRKSEIDHTTFWKMLRRERDGPGVKTLSIRNSEGRVAHDVNEILPIWRDHFAKLGTPVESNSFNHEHFETVNQKISELEQSRDIDVFFKGSIYGW